VVVTVFAVLAVALATLGLYGVVADGVSRRTREIGIRMALGESTERVQRGVLWTAATLCLTGVVIGAGAALPVAVALRRFLLPTTPNDGLVLGAISALLCAVTLVAAYLPARRASRVDPAVALRDSP
jgi:ABC-type antimicrobial peptide transport system permease subunit